MRGSVVVSAAVLAGLVCTGCATVPCRSTGGMEVTQAEGGPSFLNVDDPCFAEWLRLESALFTQTSSGVPLAHVVLRNVKVDPRDDNRSDDFTAQYKVTWFDAEGVGLDSDEALWRRVTWHGGEAQEIREPAPVPAAKRYVLRLRHAR